MVRAQTKRMVFAATFLALGLFLPFLTGQIREIGNKLLPMHLPVLLCGFICGPWWALAVGAITPPLRSVLFGMPPMMPVAVAMTFELAAYGAVAGLLMLRRPRTLTWVMISLVGAMIAGRIVWGIVSFLLAKALGNPFTWQIFAASAITNAIPGIIAQLVLVPAITLAIWRVDRTV